MELLDLSESWRLRAQAAHNGFLLGAGGAEMSPPCALSASPSRRHGLAPWSPPAAGAALRGRPSDANYTAACVGPEDPFDAATATDATQGSAAAADSSSRELVSDSSGGGSSHGHCSGIDSSSALSGAENCIGSRCNVAGKPTWQAPGKLKVLTAGCRGPLPKHEPYEEYVGVSPRHAAFGDPRRGGGNCAGGFVESPHGTRALRAAVTQALLLVEELRTENRDLRSRLEDLEGLLAERNRELEAMRLELSDLYDARALYREQMMQLYDTSVAEEARRKRQSVAIDLGHFQLELEQDMELDEPLSLRRRHHLHNHPNRLNQDRADDMDKQYEDDGDALLLPMPPPSADGGVFSLPTPPLSVGGYTSKSSNSSAKSSINGTCGGAVAAMVTPAEDPSPAGAEPPDKHPTQRVSSADIVCTVFCAEDTSRQQPRKPSDGGTRSEQQDNPPSGTVAPLPAGSPQLEASGSQDAAGGPPCAPGGPDVGKPCSAGPGEARGVGLDQPHSTEQAGLCATGPVAATQSSAVLTTPEPRHGRRFLGTRRLTQVGRGLRLLKITDAAPVCQPPWRIGGTSVWRLPRSVRAARPAAREGGAFEGAVVAAAFEGPALPGAGGAVGSQLLEHVLEPSGGRAEVVLTPPATLPEPPRQKATAQRQGLFGWRRPATRGPAVTVR